MIPRGLNPWHVLTLAVLVISLLLTTYNIHYLHIMQKQHLQTLHPETVDCTLGGGPSYAVFAKVINIKGSQINSYNWFNPFGCQNHNF